jgi:hypothetical protein
MTSHGFEAAEWTHLLPVTMRVCQGRTYLLHEHGVLPSRVELGMLGKVVCVCTWRLQQAVAARV